MDEDVFNIVGTLQDGTFHVREVVAEGGFAVVYRAYHQSFRADVALKCLKVPGMLAEAKQSEFLEKFRTEGELLFRLSAAIPAVVRPLHLGTLTTDAAPFVPFIALEWLDGMSLDQFIVRRRNAGKPPLDMQRAVRMLAPAARALEQAHHFEGPDGPIAILHRDLKPENLFVANVHGREMIKVLDFGIGKVKRAATQIAGRVSMEQSGIGAFTPAYGAPEQWLPKRFGQSGSWTDVWGFALTMVELVSGRTPLEGDAHAVMGAAMDERERPTPRVLGVEVSATVEAAFERALAVDPRERYTNIGEFWDVLEAEYGVATTRVLASPVSIATYPPEALEGGKLDALRGAPTQVDRRRSTRAISADIPDLMAPDSGTAKRTPRSARRGSGRIRAVAEFDDMPADLGMGGEVIPLTGGFRLDGPEDDSASVRQPRQNSVRPPRVGARSAPEPRRSFDLFSRLAGPAKLLLVAMLIAGADFVHTSMMGQAFQIGPVTAIWLAGPLAVFAVFKLVFALVSEN